MAICTAPVIFLLAILFVVDATVCLFFSCCVVRACMCVRTREREMAGERASEHNILLSAHTHVLFVYLTTCAHDFYFLVREGREWVVERS